MHHLSAAKIEPFCTFAAYPSVQPDSLRDPALQGQRIFLSAPARASCRSTGTLDIMNMLPRDASDEEILRAVSACIDRLAEGEYEAVANAVGYALAYQTGETPANCLRREVAAYRSEHLFPGETIFQVSRASLTSGGNPHPLRYVQRYAQSRAMPWMLGAVSYSLPLNGKWSDLTADFVLCAADEDQTMCIGLENLTQPRACDE
jgi:hypothetical protein